MTKTTRITRFAGFFLASAALGALNGVLSAGFLYLLKHLTLMVWERWAVAWPVQALALTLSGGLLVGLGRRYLGDHPRPFMEAMQAARASGRMEYRHLPHGMLNATVSLVFGASLGPEAAIMDLLGGLSTWVGDQLRALRLRWGLEPPAGQRGRRAWLARHWGGGVSVAAGLLAAVPVFRATFHGGFLPLPADAFTWRLALWGLPAGIIGGLAGAMYTFWMRWQRRVLSPLAERPVASGLLGGLALGATATFLPLVLFSGQMQLAETMQQAASLGIAVLLLTGVSKLFLTAFLLNTGWKGGQILPILFSSAALGLSASLWWPAFPPAAAVVGSMAAATTIALNNPLFAFLTILALFPLTSLPVSLPAFGVGLLMQHGLADLPKRTVDGAAPLPVPGEGD